MAAAGHRELMACMPSMSRKQDCRDNAVAESFFATLKHELLWGRKLPYPRPRTRTTGILEYVEAFYNRQRLHQTLDLPFTWLSKP
jgi:putative transposase